MLPTLFTEEAAPFVALSRLFRHLWFQRIWVVQEVAAAEVVHVMYNGICIEWNTLAQAVREIHSAINLSRQMKYYDDTKTSTIETIGRDPSLDYSYWLNAEIMATIRDQVQNGNPLPLAVLILGTLGFKSKDPRDKLFALLGIASDGADLPLTPSYNESVESVFTNVTSFVLSSESWFMLLASTGRGYEAAGSTRPPDSPLPKDLPSWVPDYTTNDFGGALSRGVRDKMLRSRQAGKVAFTDNPRVIRIEAVAFDSIRLVDSKLKYPTFGFRTPDPELPTGTFTKRMEELLTSTAAEGQNWYLEARQLTRSYSASSRESQEAADQQFWELCMSGNPSFENSDSSPALYPLLSQSARKLFEFFKLTERSHFWQHVGDWSMKEKLSEEEVVKLYTNLEQRFFETTSEKAFCVTSTGSVALAPPLAREGDVLVHVKGDYTPLVLRRKESGERRAELVGSCYVHGVQDLCPGSDWEVWSLE
ncbi:hypothetical protein H2201_007118 [Coniosporium apollinis]|uniref:Heterokaryon incompatibility domain-containing protein n=2 Tax=Coniosporium TaxID=2810619 RepID=A0ABQ9NMI9_9PEZI|nr:hypothetical protein H2199_004009 [Cladosporium sp. JES 115]KAJ9660013.1 hypothetical protein H2201_007118 [Coniosporium apollinis]